MGFLARGAAFRAKMTLHVTGFSSKMGRLQPMPDILISEDIQGDGVEDLGRSFDLVCEPTLWESPDRLKSRLRSFKALIVRNQTQVTGDVIQAAGPELQVIGRAGVGLDNIDVDAARANGVMVA